MMLDGSEYPREISGNLAYPLFPPLTTYTPCKCQGAVQHKKRIDKSGLKEVILNCTFDNYKEFDIHTKNKKELALKFIKQDVDKFFYYGGRTGAGKTHLCAAMCNEFIKQGKHVYYASYLKLSRKLNSLINDYMEYDSVFYKYANADVFYLDDLFKGHSTAADRSRMQELIDHRYTRRLTTIISSELYLENLVEIDEAFGARIGQLAGDFVLSAENMSNYRYRR